MIRDLRTMIQNGTDLSEVSVSPYLRPDTTLPAIVYEVQSEEVERNLSGITSLRTTRLSIRCLDASYAGAETVSENVVAALDGTVEGDEIVGVDVVSIQQEFEETADSKNVPLYIFEIDVSVYWEKS